MVESSAYDEIDLNIWLAEPIADTVVLYIAAGEFEAIRPDGQVTDGPFVVQVANTASASQVVTVTDPAAPAESVASGSASASAQMPSLSTAGGLPLYPVLTNNKWGLSTMRERWLSSHSFPMPSAFNFPFTI